MRKYGKKTWKVRGKIRRKREIKIWEIWIKLDTIWKKTDKIRIR